MQKMEEFFPGWKSISVGDLLFERLDRDGDGEDMTVKNIVQAGELAPQVGLSSQLNVITGVI